MLAGSTSSAVELAGSSDSRSAKLPALEPTSELASSSACERRHCAGEEAARAKTGSPLRRLLLEGQEAALATCTCLAAAVTGVLRLGLTCCVLVARGAGAAAVAAVGFAGPLLHLPGMPALLLRRWLRRGFACGLCLQTVLSAGPADVLCCCCHSGSDEQVAEHDASKSSHTRDRPCK